MTKTARKLAGTLATGIALLALVGGIGPANAVPIACTLTPGFPSYTIAENSTLTVSAPGVLSFASSSCTGDTL